jgi:hypothetical protein
MLIDPNFEADGTRYRVNTNYAAKEPEWHPFGSFVFVLTTISTVGNGPLAPKTMLGRIYTIVLIIWGIYLLGSVVFPWLCKHLLGQGAGSGEYKVNPARFGHVVVVGSPSARMLHDFLHEVFHENHFDSVQAFDESAVDVVVLLPDSATLAQVRSILSHKASMLFRHRVHLYKGEPFNTYDLERVKLQDAMRAFVLPNLVAPNPGADDGANIMRTFAIGRHAPYLHTLCMLHRAENNPATLALKGSKLSFISVDAFKLSMLAKASLTKGALSFILNLCKTTGDDNSYNLKSWQRDYGHSVGMELYEVPLSVDYDQDKFGEVALDVLHRSQVGEVIMIGVVEDPIEGVDIDDQRKVRIHPGNDYVLNVDGSMAGIFIAPDIKSIRQRGDPNDRIATELARPRAEASAAVDTPRKHDRKGARASMSPKSPVDRQDGEETARSKQLSYAQELKNNEIAQREEVEKREQAIADARYQSAMTGIKRRLLVQGVNVPLVDEVSTEFHMNVETKTEVPEEMYVTTAAKYEDEEDPKEIIRLDKNSLLYSEDEALLEELQLSNRMIEKMELHALRNAPLPANVTNHLLLCIVSDNTDNVDHLKSAATGLGPAIGIEHFMKPLRDPRIKGSSFHPTVVVLSAAMPRDWYTVVDMERVYFVRGSPLRIQDLERARFKQARTVSIARSNLKSSETQPVTDARVLLLTTQVEDALRGTGNVNVITDLSYEGSCVLLPKSKVQVESPSIQAAVPIVRTFDNIWEIFNYTAGRESSNVSFTTTSGIQSFDPPPAPENYESLPTVDYAYHYRFMNGQIFLSSAMTSFIANTLYNPELVQLIGSLMQAPLLLLPLPAMWERRAYCDLVAWLLNKRNLLALGLFRNGQAAEAGAFGKPVDETTPSHYYIFTAPPAYMTLVVRTDQILCLAPTYPASQRKRRDSEYRSE